MTRLFSDRERTDGAPAAYQEGLARFLDRVDRPYFARVRDVLDAWLAAIPGQKERSDIRGRFWSKDGTEALGAFWELYLHTALRGLGWAVEIHPPAADGLSTHPDMFVRHPGGSFYLEAVAIGDAADLRKDARRSESLSDYLNGIDCPNFFLGLGSLEAGVGNVPLAAFKRAITEWIGTLDPDAAVSGEGLAPPRRTFEISQWSLEVTAFPVRMEHRGRGHRPVGMRGAAVVWGDDGDRIREALGKKAAKYGDLDAPLVVALLCSSMRADLADLPEHLFGDIAHSVNLDTGEARSYRRRNGIWRLGSEPTNRKLSAVLAHYRLAPWTSATPACHLFVNPWAARPAPQIPFATRVEHDPQTLAAIATPPTREMHDVLGLAEDWPGREDPFGGD